MKVKIYIFWQGIGRGENSGHDIDGEIEVNDSSSLTIGEER